MNYYEILKVSPKATDSEIKSSYKKLVKKYHPDLYQGDKNFAEQKIKEINEAYDILSNSKTRKEYDDFLNPQPAPGPTYTKTTPSSYYKTTQQSPRPPRHWSFIEKKISKLDKNKQSQVIVLIFIFALLLFLISLIQTHNYLKNHQNKLTQTPEQPGYNPYYEYDHKTMDELFYEMIIQSEKEYYNTISANITNP